MNRNITKLTAIAPNFLCCFLTILFVSVYLFSGCSSIDPKCLQYSKTIDLKGRNPLLMEDDFLLCYEETIVSDDQTVTTNIEYFTVDIHSEDWNSLGILTDVTATSGDVLLAPDGNVYLTYQTIDHPVSLYKLNLKSREINLVYESTTSLPFQFLSVLDENNLVLFEPDRGNTGYTYRVIIYNLLSQKTTVVFERTTGINEEGAEQISSAFAYNGEIYCLMHKIGGDYRVDILDTAGTLERSLSLDSNKLREITTVDETEYGIWRIYVTNDIILFQTLADKMVPFSVSTGTLCGKVLQGYAINFNLSNPNQNNTLFYRTQKTEITIFVNTNEKLESYDLTVEKDGSAVSIKYTFLSNSKNEIVIIPWNSDGKVLLYELK